MSNAREVTVRLRSEHRLGTIHPGVYGVNHRYPFNGFGTWDSSADAPAAAFVEQARPIGLKLLRYPGGSVSNWFHWKSAIGPLAERPPQVSGFDGRPVAASYGPLEHMRLCAALGAEANIVVSFTMHTPQDAADWVSYMNAPDDGRNRWAALRAEHGHPEPFGVRYWEIGNELQLIGDGNKAWPQCDEELYAFGGSQRQPTGRLVRPGDWRDEACLSDGMARQRFSTRVAPVVADTLVVLVDCQPWERVDDLAVVGTGRYYQLDPSTGEVLFGDGRHGAIPPAGAIVEATYVAGPRAGFADFYQAMKAADPNIRVGSCVYSPRFFELMGDRHPYDFVTVHHYSPVSDLDFEVARRKMWRASAAIAESVDIASELRDRFAGARAAEIEVLVTEWNVKMWGRVREPVSGYFRSLDHGLFVASALNHLIARGVPAANIHDLVELPTEGASATGKSYDSAPESGVFEPAPSYRPRPAALVMSLYARHMVGDRVEATVAGEVVEGDTPMVEVCAARDERGRLVVMLLNRDPDREARVVVSPGVSAVGPAAVWRVEADGGGTATEARVVEDRVVPRGGVLTLVVPRTSLTCVEVAPLES